VLENWFGHIGSGAPLIKPLKYKCGANKPYMVDTEVPKKLTLSLIFDLGLYKTIFDRIS
jgi:hypothetical protein